MSASGRQSLYDRAAEILDLLPDLVLEIDRDLCIQGANQTALRWLGPVMDRSVLDLAVSPGDRKRMEETITSCLQNEDMFAKVSLNISNGSTRLFDMTGKWRRGARAREPVFLLVLRDITDRERQNRELERVSELLTTLVNNMPDMICVKDVEGRWQLANPAAMNIFGLNGLDYLGKTDSELADETGYFLNEINDCADLEQQAWDKRCPTRSIKTISRPDLAGRIFDVMKVPLFHRDGSRRAMLTVGRDITLLKEVERDRIILSNYLSAVSTVSTLLLQADSVEPVAGRVLEVLGRAARARRCFWFEAHEYHDRNVMSLKLEWRFRGGRDVRPGLVNIPWEGGLDRWRKILERGDPIREMLADCPREGVELFLEWGAGAVLILPLRVSGRLAGFIGFEGNKKSPMWTDEEVDLLKAGVFNFALALEKEETRRFLEFHQQVLEASPERVAVIDLDGRHILANRAYMNTVGGGVRSMAGRHVSEFFREKDFNEKIEPHISKVRDRKEPVVSEDWLHVTDQGERLIATTYFPLLNPDGTLDAVGIIGRDITELATTREEIRKREREIMRLYAAVEQLPVSVVMTDVNGDIQYVNSAFERITGFERDEALGRNPRILKSGRQDKSFYRKMWATISSGDVWQGRLVNRARDGRLFTEDAVISPVKGQGGVIIGYIAVKEDITERLALEAELRQAQKLEAVGTLAGGLAHDFNNILAALQGYVTFLKQNPTVSREGGHLLDKIERAVERGAGLTGKVLAISKPTEAVMAPVNVNDVIDEAVSVLRETTDRRISFNLDLDPGIGAVKGDSGQLVQVIMNLLVNSTQAMPGGGDIYIRTRGDGHNISIKIADTGIGIDQKLLSRIFDPFFTTKEPGQGTGLGLTMVHRIIESHHGHISVQSVKGEGTTFNISLPSMGPEEQQTGKVADEARDESEINPQAEIPTDRHRVLVVDDEPMLREILKDGLGTLGYSVVAVETGKSAFEVLKQNPDDFDLVVLDMNMPGWDGLDTLMHLREVRPDMPAILATGYADDQRLKAFERSGRVDVVYKPFKLDKLNQTIVRLLKKTCSGDQPD